MNLQKELFKNPIVVALRLGENSQNIMKLSASLARKTGASLRAIHVTEALNSIGYSYPTVIGAYDLGAWALEQQELAAYMAEKKLKELTADLKDRMAESKVIVSSDIPGTLLAESHNAPLLVLGVDKQQYVPIPKGLSVVLSILSAASIPVLLLRSGADLDFERGYSMLIADDVGPASASAVNFAVNFAKSSGARSVTHTHVLDPHMKKIAAEDFEQESRKWPEYEDFLTRAKRGMEILLRSRVESSIEDLQAEGGQCSYKTYVSAGDVSEELEKILQKGEHDMVVFGRPPLSHFKPFSLGRLAVNSLFMGAKSVLVVPPGYPRSF